MDEYTKELRRLRKNLREKIRYYNKRGYDIDPSFVKDLTLSEIQNITTEQLKEEIQEAQYERREFLDEYQIFPDEVPMIIGEFRQSYSNYHFEAQVIIDNWLNKLIREKGIDAVAIMIQQARWDGKEITSKDIYGNLANSLEEFFLYLPEGYEFEDEDKAKFSNELTNDVLEALENHFETDSYWGY